MRFSLEYRRPAIGDSKIFPGVGRRVILVKKRIHDKLLGRVTGNVYCILVPTPLHRGYLRNDQLRACSIFIRFVVKHREAAGTMI